MLVLSNPPPSGWAVKRLEGLTATEDSEAVPIKTSLIVMPANLLGQVNQFGGLRCHDAAMRGSREGMPSDRRRSILGAPCCSVSHHCASTPLPQWAEEIERHVQPGRLSWARYLPPGAAAAAAAGNQADEEDGDVATRTRRSRRVAAAGGTVRPGHVSRACALGCTLA